MQKRIPVVMITGFLGSGKTTLVKQVLQQTVSDQRIAIIQNEFAPANADTEEIVQSESGNYRMLEINNGSIFCVCLLGTFLESLEEFSEQYQPDLLLIESSGLADPIALGEIFNEPKNDSNKTAHSYYLRRSIAVVDAKHFLTLSKFQRQLRNQIRVADTIVLNKVDLIDETEPTILELRSLNPTATIQRTSFCELDWQALISEETVSQDDAIQTISIPETATGSDRPKQLQSTVYRSTKALSRIHLESFIEAIASQSLRAKGIIFCDNQQSYAFQCVLGDHEIHSLIDPTQKSFFTVISETLNHQIIENRYLQFSDPIHSGKPIQNAHKEVAS